MAAVQESVAAFLVTLETAGVPGAVGGVSSGCSAPSQGTPLSLQPVGAPSPVPLKPKVVEAPGARVPFQERFLAVQRFPSLLTSASHGRVTLVPAGNSHSSVQLLSGVSPVFCTVHRAWKPVPQSWVRVYEALGASAAWLGAARPTIPAKGIARPVRAARVRLRSRRRGLGRLPEPSCAGWADLKAYSSRGSGHAEGWVRRA